MNMKEQIESIKYKISETLRVSNREKNSCKLMAVSKFNSAEKIQEAYNLGISLFGENRVQESILKFPGLFEKTENKNMELHLIGQLQRNKVKAILPLVSCIESIDRLELLEEIQKQAQRINKKISVLFEINCGDEAKSGFTNKDDVQKSFDYLLSLDNPFIIPQGFMTVGPLTDDEKVLHKSFEYVRNLAQEMKRLYPVFQLNELSMGMTHDYQIAIEEGSTIVRIGTAIFGVRS